MGKRGRPLGWKMPDAVKQKISKSKAGYVHDEETKEQIKASLIRYYDEHGRVDRSVLVVCDACGKEFTSTTHQPAMYCEDCVPPGSVLNRGGIAKEYKKWYDKLKHRKAYKLWRLQCLLRDGYRCRHCNKPTIVVHHTIDILILKDKPEELYNPDVGVSLCTSCHGKVHWFIKRNWRRENG